jgi:hypothetical protein
VTGTARSPIGETGTPRPVRSRRASRVYTLQTRLPCVAFIVSTMSPPSAAAIASCSRLSDARHFQADLLQSDALEGRYHVCARSLPTAYRRPRIHAGARFAPYRPSSLRKGTSHDSCDLTLEVHVQGLHIAAPPSPKCVSALLDASWHRGVSVVSAPVCGKRRVPTQAAHSRSTGGAADSSSEACYSDTAQAASLAVISD